MGGFNIPLAVNPAPQNPGPMDLAQKGLNVQALINATQLQKQTQAQNALKQQSDQIELEQQQQGQKDQQAFNKAFHDAGGDWDQTIKNATQAGASGAFITKAQLARTDQVTKLATANKDLLANEQTKADQLAKDALAVRNAPADEQASLYASLRNKHIIAGTYKPNEIPKQLPSNDELDATVAHSTAAQAIMKDAADLREKNAKLPGEQAEARGKSLTTASQTMNGVPNQLAWTARRNMLVGNDPTLKDLIPEQYSPDAVEQVRQLGITPQQAAQTPVEKQELNDFMKNPPKGYKPTPTDFLRYQKSITPNITNLLAITGGGLGPTAGAGGPQGGGTVAPISPDQIAAKAKTAPGGWVSPTSGKTLNDVPAAIRGEVQQVLEYRRDDPTFSARGPVAQAVNSWVAELDPHHNEGLTFKERNDTLKKFQTDAAGGELGAVNTALGHLGELQTAAQALNQNNIPILHSIAAHLGLATGDDAASTYQAILHRVGPEMTKAYIKGGGTEGERGSNEADFDIGKGAKQIVSNIAESAQLLNSKLASKKQAWETGYAPYREQDSFENRFLTPDARKTLATLSSQAPTNKAGAGGGHVIAIGGKNYRYNGSGPTNDLKSYTPVQ